MTRIIRTCEDGSFTIYDERFMECYHSNFSAVKESLHNFLDCGLKLRMQEDNIKYINIFEMGFGTGLNTLITLLESFTNEDLKDIPVYYESLEKYPLSETEWSALAYHNELAEHFSLKTNEIETIYKRILSAEWDKKVALSDNFTLKKRCCDISDYSFSRSFDLVYYDAFSPNTQPELWSEDIFSKIYNNLNSNAILTTYSSKGSVKTALRNSGFEVKRITGVGRKKHIVRAVKLP